ncbi:Uncharacterised protein [Bordetella pertussis]|nr:Uncharacterised protein [Bordetella pertussis]
MMRMVMISDRPISRPGRMPATNICATDVPVSMA